MSNIRKHSDSHDIKHQYTNTKTNKNFLNIYNEIKMNSNLKDFEIARTANIPRGSFARIKYGYVPTHENIVENLSNVLRKVKRGVNV